MSMVLVLSMEITENEPVESPLQVVTLPAPEVIESVGEPNVLVIVIEHPMESVAVTTYWFGARSVIDEPVAPDDHTYVHPPFPPVGVGTDMDPSLLPGQVVSVIVEVAGHDAAPG